MHVNPSVDVFLTHPLNTGPHLGTIVDAQSTYVIRLESPFKYGDLELRTIIGVRESPLVRCAL